MGMIAYFSVSSKPDAIGVPKYAAVELNNKFVSKLHSMRDIVCKNNLKLVTVEGGPDFWGCNQKDNIIKINSDEINCGKCDFWFSAQLANSREKIETIHIRIIDFFAVVDNATLKNEEKIFF